MMQLKTPFILTLFITACVFVDKGISQSDCHSAYYSVFGSSFGRDKGYSLAVDENQNALYVGGIKDDSLVLIRIDLNGFVEWVRTIDLIPFRQEHIMGLVVDSEGMVVAGGIIGTTEGGGSIFAFRYNPDLDQVLWVKEYTPQSNSYCNGIIEKGPGGNYLIMNNPQDPNNAEILELNRTTGAVVPQFSKNYSLQNSDSFGDMVFYENSLYATGRFSNGFDQGSMRHFIVKLNQSSGVPAWVKIGHRSANSDARLYGASLKILHDTIYSVYMGDENGSSIDDTEVFIQKTTLNGDLVWVKKYPLPGVNDWADEIIISGNGFVVLARNRVAPSDLILFKIDHEGRVLWARKFDYSGNDNTISIGSTQGQLLEAKGSLYFTAYSESSGSPDIVIVKTDLEGNISDTCIENSNITIVPVTIQNPSFFPVTLSVFNASNNVVNRTPMQPKETSLESKFLCERSTMLETFLSQTICEGDMYEGYSMTGLYSDQFTTDEGCDSIRNLELIVTTELFEEEVVRICAGNSYAGYSSPGIYQDTFVTTAGCDSIRNLELIVATELFEEEVVRICSGHSYAGYTLPGIYQDTFVTMAGCDSIRNLNLIVLESLSGFASVSLCDGSVMGHNMVGTYVDTLTSVAGCDSILTLEVGGASKYIPNVFSPNDDNINDLFTITPFPEDALDLHYFAIFDRFGDMVLETESWPIEWNGRTQGGKEYQNGVFAFVLNYTCGSSDVIEHGTITLVR